MRTNPLSTVGLLFSEELLLSHGPSSIPTSTSPLSSCFPPLWPQFPLPCNAASPCFLPASLMLLQSSRAHTVRKRWGIEPTARLHRLTLQSVHLHPSSQFFPPWVGFMASIAVRRTGISSLCTSGSLLLCLLQTRAVRRLLGGCSCWTWHPCMGSPGGCSTEAPWQCDIQDIAPETEQEREEGKADPKKHPTLQPLFRYTTRRVQVQTVCVVCVVCMCGVWGRYGEGVCMCT